MIGLSDLKQPPLVFTLENCILCQQKRGKSATSKLTYKSYVVGILFSRACIYFFAKLVSIVLSDSLD